MRSVKWSMILSCAAIGSAVAAPDVSNVVLSQPAGSRRACVRYDLAGEAAVITVDIQTNTMADASGEYVSIGDANLHFISGDVNRLVQPGTDHMIIWRPDKAWPGHTVNTPTVRAVVTAWEKDAPPDYMVCDLQSAGCIRYYTSEAALPDGPATSDVYKTTKLLMRRIHAANETWTMGAANLDGHTVDGAETAHAVTLTEDYYLGVFEITRRQLETACGWSWGFPESDAKLPVTGYCWKDWRGWNSVWPGSHAIDPDNGMLGSFIAKTGVAFDFPTEAQWEYACRAGSTTDFYNGTNNGNKSLGEGETDANLDALAWYQGNSGGVLHDVGGKQPNAWGLYDMLGNASEWCLDWMATDLGAAAVTDPVGLESGENRAVRGLSYDRTVGWFRCIHRINWTSPETKSGGLGARFYCPCEAK